MYATKAVNGVPAIQCDGRSVLSVCNRNWEFANWLCELLNELNDTPTLLLSEEDCKWLMKMDQAFAMEVQHA